MSPGQRELKSEALLAELAALHPRRIDLSLERMRRLLAALEHPEQRVPPVVHVAGTNGKGSTVALLEAAMRAQGLRVDTYVSPHLVRFNERIRLEGCEIGEAGLAHALRHVRAAAAGMEITFFEATTAAAFLAFATAHTRSARDFLLLEVGLGGRLDATNVAARIACSVITAIGRDHEGFLGKSHAGIAVEKAGIFKHGVPAVAAPQTPIVARTLVAEAERVGVSRLLLGGRDWRIRATRTGEFRLVCPSLPQAEGLWRAPQRLAGAHQKQNAALAIVTGSLLGVPRAALLEGLAHGFRHARLERLDAGALRAVLPHDWELRLDGAHNAHAARAVARSLCSLDAGDPRPWCFVVSLLEGKRPLEFLRALRTAAGAGSCLASAPMPGEEAGDGGHAGEDAEALATTARSLGWRAEAATGLVPALERLVEMREGAASRVLICGSLYQAGAALAASG